MQTPDKQASDPSSNTGRIWKLIGSAIAVISLLILLAPMIIAKTSLRDVLINSAIANDSIAVSTGSASFGYTTPLQISEFNLREKQGSVDLKIGKIETDKSWLILLFSKADLGTFRFVKPEIEVVTGIASTTQPTQADATSGTPEPMPGAIPETTPDEEAKATPTIEPEETADLQASEQKLPNLVAEITDASVRVRNVSSSEPAIDLQGIDFTIRIEDAKSGSNLVVDPTTILDNAVLTPQLCGQGLHLVAPMLSDVVNVTGNVSFRLDRFIVPIGAMPEAERREIIDIAGSIELADVTVGLKGKIMEALLPLLDRLGHADGPSGLTVNKASAIQFHVVDGRIHHKGLVMQMPLAGSALEIASSGSVGMDETIDVQLEIGIPDDMLGDSALAKFFSVESVRIRVSGTLDEPQIDLDSDSEWADRLTTLLVPLKTKKSETAGTGDDDEDPDAPDPKDSMEKFEDVADSILGIVGGLLEESKSDDNDKSPSLRDRIRSRRNRSEGRGRLLPQRNRKPIENDDAQESAKQEPVEI